MKPMNLVSLLGPHGIKRMGIHVFVDRKIQFIPRSTVGQQRLPRLRSDLRSKGSQPTDVRGPVQQVVTLDGKARLAGQDKRIRDRKSHAQPLRGRLHPQYGKQRWPGVHLVQPPVKRVQGMLVGRRSDFKVKMRSPAPP